MDMKNMITIKKILKHLYLRDQKKRYTFLTGEEEQEIRKYNKEAFNHDKM